MKTNPKIEIAAMADDEWIRITSEVAVDNTKAAKQAVLKDALFLKDRFSANDGKFEVLYFTKGTSVFHTPFGTTSIKEL